MLDTALVNHTLAALGYAVKKGQSRLVAEAIAADKQVASSDCIDAYAKKLGLVQPPKKQKVKPGKRPTLARPHVEYAPLPGSVEAAQWIADESYRMLMSSDYKAEALQVVLDEAVQGNSAKIVGELSRGDYSTRGQLTDKPHDWSRFATFAEFMEEPNGNTMATYCSGCGLVAEKLERDFEEELRSIQYRVLREVGNQDNVEAPEQVKMFLAGLTSDELDMFIMDDSYEVLESLGCWVETTMSEIGTLPFLATLEEHEPDEQARVNIARKKQESHTQMVQVSADLRTTIEQALLTKFAGQPLTRDSYMPALLCALSFVRNEAGVLAVKQLLEDNDLQSCFNKKGYRAFMGDLDAWVSLVEDDGLDDVDAPLITLFHALSSAWTRDGRSWFITIHDEPGTYTFGSDNFINLLAFALTHRSVQRVVTLRRFEPAMYTEKIPYKTVSMMLLDGNNVELFDMEDVKACYAVDCETSEPLELEKDLLFASSADLVPEFAFATGQLLASTMVH